MEQSSQAEKDGRNLVQSPAFKKIEHVGAPETQPPKTGDVAAQLRGGAGVKQ
jgi:hypothetical protein